MKTNPIGLSTCGNKPLDEQGFASMKEAGIDVIELSSGNYDTFDFQAIRVNSETYGVKLWTLHLPFMPFDQLDISSCNPALRTHTISFVMDLIKKASEYGIDKYVIHPSGEPIDDSEREERMKCAMDSLHELAEKAAACGSVLVVEDLPRTCLGRDSFDINRLISVHDKLRVCFDTNHLLSEEIPSFIRNVGSKIITTHISDYDRVNERHWLPGEGVINWQELYQTLQEIHYTGPWLYELGYDCPGSIVRRPLTNADFAENALSIFRGEAPSAIGTVKENLGFWG